MKQIDKTHAQQAEIGQGAAANQLITDQTEILKLMKAPPFSQGAQLAPHGRAKIKVTVIDQPWRARKDAVVRLAVGLNQSIHGAIHSRETSAMLAPELTRRHSPRAP